MLSWFLSWLWGGGEHVAEPKVSDAESETQTIPKDGAVDNTGLLANDGVTMVIQSSSEPRDMLKHLLRCAAAQLKKTHGALLVDDNSLRSCLQVVVFVRDAEAISEYVTFFCNDSFFSKYAVCHVQSTFSHDDLARYLETHQYENCTGLPLLMVTDHFEDAVLGQNVAWRDLMLNACSRHIRYICATQSVVDSCREARVRADHVLASPGLPRAVQEQLYHYYGGFVREFDDFSKRYDVLTTTASWMLIDNTWDGCMANVGRALTGQQPFASIEV